MSARLKIVNPVWILVLLCTAYSLSFFQRVYPSVLSLDLMEAFAVDTAGFGLISSATMLGYAVTQIPSGLLTDIMGGRRALALYQLFAGLCCMAFTLCESLMPAVACRFLLGLTLACNVPAYKLLAFCVPAECYARYCSILTGCGAVGTLLASSPLVAVTGLVGWRAALFMVGVFTVLLGGMMYVLLHDGEVSAQVPASMGDNLRDLKRGIAEVVRMKNFWFIVLWFMFMIGNLFTLLTAWWGGYLMQANGLSKDMAGLSMSIMSLTPLPFLMVFPWLSDRVVHSRRVFLPQKIGNERMHARRREQYGRVVLGDERSGRDYLVPLALEKLQIAFAKLIRSHFFHILFTPLCKLSLFIIRRRVCPHMSGTAISPWERASPVCRRSRAIRSSRAALCRGTGSPVCADPPP